MARQGGQAGLIHTWAWYQAGLHVCVEGAGPSFTLCSLILWRAEVVTSISSGWSAQRMRICSACCSYLPWRWPSCPQGPPSAEPLHLCLFRWWSPWERLPLVAWQLSPHPAAPWMWFRRWRRRRPTRHGDEPDGLLARNTMFKVVRRYPLFP